MRYTIILLVFFLLSIFNTQSASAKRIALVIGNSSYKNVPALDNPKNDATLIGQSLARLNFSVTILTDATQKQMKRAIIKYFKALREAGPDTVGLIFYAGHGVQVDGQNYLIPIDAKIKHESDIELEAVSASNLLGGMKHIGNRLNIILFDACRNNPYKSSFRSGNRGLARMDAPEGSFIAFATSPGEVASDGAGKKNSPFSEALADNLLKPGLTIEQVVKRVGRHVKTVTKGNQLPWYSSSVYTDFYLFPGKPVEPEPPATNKTSNECDVQDKPLKCLGVQPG